MGFFFLVDPQFAAAELRALKKGVRPSYYFAYASVLYSTWLFFNGVGALFGALIEAGANGKGDEFSKADKVENSLVKDAMAAHAAKKKEKVQNEIIQVLSLAETVKDQQIVAIRTARKAEAAAKKKLDDLDKARAYAEKTGNFCPLLRRMGYSVPDENVPAEFRQ